MDENSEYIEQPIDVRLKSMIQSFFNILQTYPRIMGEFNIDDIDKHYSDVITLIYNDGNRKNLKCKGSAWDFNIGEDYKWDGKTTKEQLANARDNSGNNPKTVQYKQENNFPPNQPVNELTLEFPWEFVERIANLSHVELLSPDNLPEKFDILEVPYKIVGGEYKLFLKL